jgi:hypothetical protein
MDLVEENGGKWRMDRLYRGLRNVKPQTFYPDIPIWAYHIPDMMVCQALNTAQKSGKM